MEQPDATPSYDAERFTNFESEDLKQMEPGAPQDISENQHVHQDEAAAIGQLAASSRNQVDLERDIGREADRLLLEQALDRDNKRLEKANAQRAKLISQIRKLEQRSSDPSSTTLSAATRINAEIEHLQPQLESLDNDIKQIEKRMEERQEDSLEVANEQDQAGNTRRQGESKRDFLIRTGKITPFSRMGQSTNRVSANLAEVMLDAEGGEDTSGQDEDDVDTTIEDQVGAMSHRNLLAPGYKDSDTSSQADSGLETQEERPRKKRRLQKLQQNKQDGTAAPSDQSDMTEEESKLYELSQSSESEGDSDFEISEEKVGHSSRIGSKGKAKPSKKSGLDYEESSDAGIEDLAGIDDGDEKVYSWRLDKWTKGRKVARQKAQTRRAIESSEGETLQSAQSQLEHDARIVDEEWLMPHPTRPDAVFEDSLRIPGDIYPSLFDYQKTGVKWLAELYSQQVGGIVGDEMGLGKTIQVIAFLAGLHHSDRLKQPIIVVTPATVMRQWVNEFHRWWPPLRVSILHTSGSGMMDVRSERFMEDELEAGADGRIVHKTGSNKAARKVVNRVLKDGHVLVTTYAGLQSYADLLLPINWGYAVLDEGHKIRNPNAKITIFCKSLRTPNRIILSGTPMQNNLTELWSLFDFIFPLRLGNLVSFRTQFEIPIKQGGYANASNLQVETALKCAETLKDAISPYLLQRLKIDVAADLPKKSEQVLFCRLTKVQRDAYELFLSSGEMTAILNGRRHSLYGIDILRKISNHPDLVDHKRLSIKPGYNYGSGSKSGKMQVVKALLELWRDTGHKTLLFAQHRIMLDILEKFIKIQGDFNYCRMDGTTPIKDRQNMVDAFNNDPKLHVFLLTTNVGGLGVNLTGADRVIIYDPDWNPSTDVQARERSWRLGQKREVMIYRLMTAGTIEEKIYHRQIFKQFLTNKILRDPKQRQTFQLKDLHDLFTLGGEEEQTETSGLFKGSEVKFGESAITESDQGLSTTPKEENINSIVGISRREKFETGEETKEARRDPRLAHPNSDDSKTRTEAADSINNDSRVLSSIFARSGVHSALEHDAIMGVSSKSKITADPAIIAAEAKKIAAAAARGLERAGEQARNTPIGTPTWTGTVGTAGRPEDPRWTSRVGRGGFGGGRGGRGSGPSSASILASLSARQQDSSVDSSRGSTPANEQPHGTEFMTLIRDYLKNHGGSVYTQMLIDHFNRFCRTPEKTAEFKEMLRTIAVLDRGEGPGNNSNRGNRFARTGDRSRGGRAKWVLKKEYGGTA